MMFDEDEFEDEFEDVPIIVPNTLVNVGCAHMSDQFGRIVLVEVMIAN